MTPAAELTASQQAALFKTSDMEAGVHLLASQYTHVIARSVHRFRVNGPIRLRMKLLKDLECYLGRYAQSATQAAAWAKKGGVFINFLNDTPDVPHDAQLLCECPFSLDELDRLTRNATTAAVIYQPPSWNPHRSEFDVLFPTPETCRKFYEALEPCISDADLCKKVGVSGTALSYIRHAVLYGKRAESYQCMYKLVPRIEPEDKRLMLMFDWLRSRRPTEGLYSKSDVSPKSILRALVRCGSVEHKGQIGFYNVKVKPDYERITRVRAGAWDKLNEIIDAVDAAPELTASALKPLAPREIVPIVPVEKTSRRSRSLARREAWARARCTTD